MPTRYLQLAHQYLGQASQMVNTAQHTPQSPVRQRQEVMAARALKKAIAHIEAALKRMGMENVPEDDGSFG